MNASSVLLCNCDLVWEVKTLHCGSLCVLKILLKCNQNYEASPALHPKGKLIIQETDDKANTPTSNFKKHPVLPLVLLYKCV